MVKELFVSLMIGTFAQSATAQVVAVVGKTEITLKDFNRLYSEVKKQTINPPPPEIFLEDLIRFEVGYQEAMKENMPEDPIVKERIKQVVYKGHMDKVIGSKVESINVTEAELRDYYKKNPEIRSSHILIQIPSDSSADKIEVARKRAKEIYADVKKSKRPFEELVKLYSDDTPSKATGGDIGFQNRLTVPPTYYDAIYKAAANEIVGPIQTPLGFHIVKSTGRRPYQDADRVQIRAAVTDIKRKELFDSYFKKISSRYTVTKNEKLLKSVK